MSSRAYPILGIAVFGILNGAYVFGPSLKSDAQKKKEAREERLKLYESFESSQANRQVVAGVTQSQAPLTTGKRIPATTSGPGISGQSVVKSDAGNVSKTREKPSTTSDPWASWTLIGLWRKWNGTSHFDGESSTRNASDKGP
ncbi:MAG: hypothetical protein M1825_001104 [Sarcosagium campestre]|nr:MAG: hypothetical protein M1825_001104 [Sarcosagium campestre]